MKYDSDRPTPEGGATPSTWRGFAWFVSDPHDETSCPFCRVVTVVAHDESDALDRVGDIFLQDYHEEELMNWYAKKTGDDNPRVDVDHRQLPSASV